MSLGLGSGLGLGFATQRELHSPSHATDRIQHDRLVLIERRERDGLRLRVWPAQHGHAEQPEVDSHGRNGPGEGLRRFTVRPKLAISQQSARELGGKPGGGHDLKSNHNHG